MLTIMVVKTSKLTTIQKRFSHSLTHQKHVFHGTANSAPNINFRLNIDSVDRKQRVPGSRSIIYISNSIEPCLFSEHTK
jgi:hypothetical protein